MCSTSGQFVFALCRRRGVPRPILLTRAANVMWLWFCIRRPGPGTRCLSVCLLSVGLRSCRKVSRAYIYMDIYRSSSCIGLSSNHLFLLFTMNTTASASSATVAPESRAADAASPPMIVAELSLKKRPWRPYITPWTHIVGTVYPGNGTNEDPFVVDWIDNDAENPMTWSERYKWIVTLSVAIATLAVAMASSTLYVQPSYHSWNRAL